MRLLGVVMQYGDAKSLVPLPADVPYYIETALGSASSSGRGSTLRRTSVYVQDAPAFDSTCIGQRTSSFPGAVFRLVLPLYFHAVVSVPRCVVPVPCITVQY